MGIIIDEEPPTVEFVGMVNYEPKFKITYKSKRREQAVRKLAKLFEIGEEHIIPNSPVSVDATSGMMSISWEAIDKLSTKRIFKRWAKENEIEEYMDFKKHPKENITDEEAILYGRYLTDQKSSSSGGWVWYVVIVISSMVLIHLVLTQIAKAKGF